MGNLKYFLGVGLLVVLIRLLGFAWGPLVGLVAMVLFAAIRKEYRAVKTLERYGRRIENIYVVTKHPETGEKPFLGDLGTIDGLVRFAPYGRATKTMNTEQGLLQQSGNHFWQQGKIDIIPIIFQDGVNVNESWGEFEQRVIEEIKQDRAKRHEGLKAQNSVWYMEHGNDERQVYEWEKVKEK